MRGFCVVVASLLIANNLVEVSATPGRSTIYAPHDIASTKLDQIIVKMDKGKTSEAFESRFKVKKTARAKRITKTTKKKRVKVVKDVVESADGDEIEVAEYIEEEVEADSVEDQMVYHANTGEEDIIAFAGIDDLDLEDILNDPDVESAEYVCTYRVGAAAPRQVGAINLPWHLDRINQRTSDLDGDATNVNAQQLGINVKVFIVDTGVDITHPVFTAGSAKHCYNAFEMDGVGPDDSYGHGTHVASLVSGVGYGMATQAKIRSVKVLDAEGGGDTLTILAGLNKIRRRVTRDKSGDRHVVVMSLTGPPSNMIDAMIVKLFLNNALVVVAAGNYAQDACSYTPARNPAALTVGAINKDDTMTTFSNWGSCIDIMAPGAQITAAVPNGQFATYDGTSMSAPIVAGVAASLWSQAPKMTARQINRQLVIGSTLGALMGGGFDFGTPNHLIFSNLVIQKVTMSQFRTGELTMEILKGFAGFDGVPDASSEGEWQEQRRRWYGSSYEASRRYYGSFFVEDTGAVLSYAGVGAAEVTQDGRANVNGIVVEGDIVGGDFSPMGSAGYMSIDAFMNMIGMAGATLYDFKNGIVNSAVTGVSDTEFMASRRRYRGR
ncbi:hypothetical protein SARC_02642 [Sphaeroforma arctica JP610]|uniref:Peptidase S8/S53 domain-containing protein n=1 Tax=Sphaeroforma arctica JP610 TaxID=667725 RepID=A0A0L0G8B9_9EUKA|nr:hypothetical protein SARC_02642 [Sphaeroforma arctica JP610]KNC85149.1 hypothetical protein SARC_02642 [Sphaeroforma arctica JP610]|eukprot:XP_014159051.1 hypothetical protein SARC_02642 [Sphaeroforma arctica JP610]